MDDLLEAGLEDHCLEQSNLGRVVADKAEKHQRTRYHRLMGRYQELSVSYEWNRKAWS